MIKSILSLGLICLASTNISYSQIKQDSLATQQLEEVVVTDTKFDLEKLQSGKAITSITSEVLKHLKGSSVATVLNSVVGFEINGSRGNDGQNLNYYVRGGRNRQVLIVVDGIQLTDPSQIANDYDLRLIQIEQIESIEILKGAASTLYGSGAATAVINIKLKKEVNKKFAINYSTALGTNHIQDDQNYKANSFRNNGLFSGLIGALSYKFSIANQFSQGISSIASGNEEDPYSAVHSQIQLGYTFHDHLNITAYYNSDHIKSNFDDGFIFEDADNDSRSRQERLGFQSDYKYKEGSFIINAAFNKIDREISSSFPTKFLGETKVVDAYNRYKFNSKFYVTAGLNLIESKMESFTIPFGDTGFQQDINSDQASFLIVDPYANVLFLSDFGLNINAGLRINNHSEYGSHLVYSVNPSYRLNTADTNNSFKLMASYSTAYITPSLYQLFEPSFGNDALLPEENRTIEVGLVFSNMNVEFGAIYFNRKEKNFIDFIDLGNFEFQYKNINEEFTASGYELTGKLNLTDDLIFNANAAIFNVEEKLNLRIPKFKANASLAYSISNRLFTRIDYQFNDTRADQYFDPNAFENLSVTLNSYSLLNSYLNYELKQDKVNIFLNVFNILNSDYEEVHGYTTKGRNINIGFSLEL